MALQGGCAIPAIAVVLTCMALSLMGCGGGFSSDSDNAAQFGPGIFTPSPEEVDSTTPDPE
jgi:hypothetical protein